MKMTYTKFDDLYFYRALDRGALDVATYWRCDGILKEDHGDGTVIERYRFIAVPESHMSFYIDMPKEEVDQYFKYEEDFYNVDMEAEAKKEHPFWEMPF